MRVSVLEAPARPKKRRKRYRATHAVQLYGPTSKGYSQYGAAGEFSGADNGFRCFHLLKIGSKWVHLVEVATQTLRKCEISVWNKIMRKGYALDRKGRPLHGECAGD
jgi:hypothetical protein